MIKKIRKIKAAVDFVKFQSNVSKLFGAHQAESHWELTENILAQMSLLLFGHSPGGGTRCLCFRGFPPAASGEARVEESLCSDGF